MSVSTYASPESTLSKKRTQHRYFLVNITNFLNVAFYGTPLVTAFENGQRINFQFNFRKICKIKTLYN